MFAGIVVFSILGFKATMTYEKCLADRNQTLQKLLTSEKLLTVNESDQVVLPVCDLEKELDNVSTTL